MTTEIDESKGRRSVLLKHMREKLNTIEYLISGCECDPQQVHLWLAVSELIGIVDAERRDLIEGEDAPEALPF